jgi:hypothetical protein
LSCAFGDALYPDPQWRQLAQVWDSLYPVDGRPPGSAPMIRALMATMPAFVRLVLGHRPASLRGRALGQVLHGSDRTPDQLVRLYQAWMADRSVIPRTRPAVAFAVVGQARARGLLTPEGEDHLLGQLISYWALQSTLQLNARLAGPPYQPLPAVSSRPRPAVSRPPTAHDHRDMRSRRDAHV